VPRRTVVQSLRIPTLAFLVFIQFHYNQRGGFSGVSLGHDVTTDMRLVITQFAYLRTLSNSFTVVISNRPTRSIASAAIHLTALLLVYAHSAYKSRWLPLPSPLSSSILRNSSLPSLTSSPLYRETPEDQSHRSISTNTSTSRTPT
jgi:hypothetical protein